MVAGLVICAAALLTGCPCGCVWVFSGAAELCLLSLLLGAGLAVIEPLPVVCSCASSCGTGGLSAACPAAGYPYRVTQTFLALVACPAPALELCLLGLQCLWCGTWFSTLCRALLPGPVVLGSFPCSRLPFGVSAFSDAVCLAYCCVGGLGWAATLPLCSQCFSCAGWLVGVHWVLLPGSGSSHGGCNCSLGGGVVVPSGSPCLSGFVTFSVISSCGSPPRCSLTLEWVRFWPAVSTAPVRGGVCCLGSASWLVLLLRSLLVPRLLLRWGGLVTRLWPLLLLRCVGLLWGLYRAVLSPWALARPALSGLCLWIPMVSWFKLLVFS